MDGQELKDNLSCFLFILIILGVLKVISMITGWWEPTTYDNVKSAPNVRRNKSPQELFDCKDVFRDVVDANGNKVKLKDTICNIDGTWEVVN